MSERVIDGVLYKDENNKLAVGTSMFVLLVDHYAPASGRPGYYRVFGEKVDVVIGRFRVADFFMMMSEDYYLKGMDLVRRNVHDLYKLIETRHPPMTVFFCTLLEYATLGWVDILPNIPKEINLLKDYRYATGVTSPDFSLLLPEQYFDTIKRIKDVKDTYIDIAKIWQANPATETSSTADITEPLQQRRAEAT